MNHNTITHTYEVESVDGQFVGSVTLTKENTEFTTRSFRDAFQRVTGHEAVKVYTREDATHVVTWDEDSIEFYIKAGKLIDP